jgi:hypothetical protein
MSPYKWYGVLKITVCYIINKNMTIIIVVWDYDQSLCLIAKITLVIDLQT